MKHTLTKEQNDHVQRAVEDFGKARQGMMSPAERKSEENVERKKNVLRSFFARS